MVQSISEIIAALSGSIVDILVYTAIGAVTVIGFLKCVFPVRSVSRSLRHAVNRLEKGALTYDDEGRPEWQLPGFLGKRLEGAWRRFLANAKQLDARGLTCDVCDYINDDTTIYAVSHAQLAEIIPSLLTSLGILGTFIGLATGLGKLKLSGSNMMETIPEMINGMSFAFMTSIVGVACSLCFNIVNRMAMGSAVNAIDDFQDAFSGIIMQRPVEDSVRLIIQQEDQAMLLRHSVGDLSGRVAEGINTAVSQSLMPVTRSMNEFILGQTQSQMDGLSRITDRFIENMVKTMGGQLTNLGRVLTEVTQEQKISLDSLNTSLGNAGQMINDVRSLQQVTKGMGERLNSLLNSMQSVQQENDQFLLHGSQVLSGLMDAAGEQGTLLSSLADSQRALQGSMKDYADWSGRAFNAVEARTAGAEKAADEVRKGMEGAADRLKDAYTDFVSSFSAGMTRSVSLFENSMKEVNSMISGELASMKAMTAADPESQTKLESTVRDLIKEMGCLGKAINGFCTELNEKKPEDCHA